MAAGHDSTPARELGGFGHGPRQRGARTAFVA